jgi:hypothetical protein
MQSLVDMAQSANTIVVSLFDEHSAIGSILRRSKNATYLYSSIFQSNVYDQRTKMIAIVAGTGLAIFASHLLYRDIRSLLKCSKKKKRTRIRRVILMDVSTMTDNDRIDLTGSTVDPTSNSITPTTPAALTISAIRPTSTTTIPIIPPTLSREKEADVRVSSQSDDVEIESVSSNGGSTTHSHVSLGDYVDLSGHHEQDIVCEQK